LFIEVLGKTTLKVLGLTYIKTGKEDGKKYFFFTLKYIRYFEFVWGTSKINESG